jgi:hypothetical protein
MAPRSFDSGAAFGGAGYDGVLVGFGREFEERVRTGGHAGDAYLRHLTVQRGAIPGTWAKPTHMTNAFRIGVDFSGPRQVAGRRRSQLRQARP